MTPPPATLRVRVASGDVLTALLRPHQVLVSSADASQLGVQSHSLWRLRAGSTDTPLLQLVGDRRSHEHGGLPTGIVQLHPWAMDTLGLVEGDHATIETAARGSPARGRISKVVLTVVTRSPLRTASASAVSALSAASSASALDSAAAATYTLLPESVRSGLVDLKRAIARQLRGMYHASGSLVAPGDLVPVQLMGETFVFRTIDVKFEASEEEEAGLVPEIIVLGSSTAERSKTSVEDVEARMRDLQLVQDNGEEDLNKRLWGVGFCGYASFIKDTLFHILLHFPSLNPTLQRDASAIQSLVSCGLILHGVHGVGKSLALRVVDNELQRRRIPTWRVDAMSLLMEYENSRVASAYEFLMAQLSQFLPTYGLRRLPGSSAAGSAAGVVLIDDLHVLFQPTNGQDTADASDGDQSALMLMPLGSALLRFLDSITDPSVAASHRVCIVGTVATGANDSDGGAEDGTMPAVAKRSGRFDKLIELIVPTEAMRREVLSRHLSDPPLASEIDGTPANVDCAANLASRLAAITGGYVAKDLVRICRSAYIHAFSSANATITKTSVTWDHLVLAQRQIKPSQLQQLNVASPSSAESETESAGPFAGYEALQKQLCDFIDWKFHPSQAMKHLGVANASGLLIHGPSGCGKTLLVKALAAKAKVNFVSVKSSELLSKYFGDSERAVRELFARARAASPCLLFFDEFDSIAHKRSFGGLDAGGGDGSGVYARILSTFLNEMDGVGGSRNRAADVLVVAATNRIDALDAALIRPGRIDKSVELGYPQREDCEAILRFYTRRMPLSESVDLSALAGRSTGSRSFTGADIAAICKEAAFRALREDIDAHSVSWDHLVAAWDQRAR